MLPIREISIPTQAPLVSSAACKVNYSSYKNGAFKRGENPSYIYIPLSNKRNYGHEREFV
jgi:hypothetical protein